MKKLLSSILAIVMVSTLTLPTLATSPATILEDIANSTIQITETADGNGTASLIADETVNIHAGYAHKTVGLGDISVGIDATGTPSFSVGRGSVTEYIARPVTVTY